MSVARVLAPNRANEADVNRHMVVENANRGAGLIERAMDDLT